MTEIVNAVIEGASLEIEDHGFLSSFLHLDYGDSHQGFGGYAIGYEYGILKEDRHTTSPNFAAEWVVQCLRIAGVRSWDKLKGQTIRVKRTGGWGGDIIAIGHIVKDEWFEPKVRFKEMEVAK